MRTSAWRRHQNRKVIRKRQKDWMAVVGEKRHIVLTQKNRMSKKHPLDCGIPGCWACTKSPKDLLNDRTREAARRGGDADTE